MNKKGLSEKYWKLFEETGEITYYLMYRKSIEK